LQQYFCSFVHNFRSPKDVGFLSRGMPTAGDRSLAAQQGCHPEFGPDPVSVESIPSRSDWKGLFYIMGKGTLNTFQFMYVGKAETRGVKNKFSVNLKGVNRGVNKHKFARWGDGLAYHIGDLSQAVFGNKGYKNPHEITFNGQDLCLKKHRI
jgi:hypothetical protein